MKKSFKFEKEIAESIGVESAILLSWIREKNDEAIKIAETKSEFTFWSEKDLMSFLMKLEQQNLIGLNINKKIIYKTKKNNNNIQINKVHKKSSISKNWNPSKDAIEILTRAGIDQEFLENLIPEFVIYWIERSDVLISYNSKFIEHARLKWAQHTAEIQTRKVPSVITDDWQPSQDCLDIIAMADIDNNFIMESLPEFRLYWKEDGRSSVSWDSKFISFIKKRASFFDSSLSNQNKASFNWYNPYEEDKKQLKSNKQTVGQLRKKHNI